MVKAALPFLLLASLIVSCTSQPSDSNNLDPTDTTTTQTTDTIPVGRYDGDTAEAGNCIWVAAYYRSDGTCVRGHWTSARGQKCSLVGSVYVECE